MCQQHPNSICVLSRLHLKATPWSPCSRNEEIQHRCIVQVAQGHVGQKMEQNVNAFAHIHNLNIYWCLFLYIFDYSVIFQEIISSTQGVSTDWYCFEAFGFSVGCTLIIWILENTESFLSGQSGERAQGTMGKFFRDGLMKQSVIFLNLVPSGLPQACLPQHVQNSVPPRSPVCFITWLSKAET